LHLKHFRVLIHSCTLFEHLLAIVNFRCQMRPPAELLEVILIILIWQILVDLISQFIFLFLRRFLRIILILSIDMVLGVLNLGPTPVVSGGGCLYQAIQTL
jgi:hypothetical protein